MSTVHRYPLKTAKLLVTSPPVFPPPHRMLAQKTATEAVLDKWAKKINETGNIALAVAGFFVILMLASRLFWVGTSQDYNSSAVSKEVQKSFDNNMKMYKDMGTRQDFNEKRLAPNPAPTRSRVPYQP